ncbi:hypothetical protein Taro_017273 [Colocasia esculenta]|uniref:Uncharacterized protein n=1 Tax=Colocasia esculenta TaxID=4460 RepID=A0A843UN60_COLES|nr:hypothetical protein [Colocasia esculenta]
MIQEKDVKSNLETSQEGKSREKAKANLGKKVPDQVEEQSQKSKPHRPNVKPLSEIRKTRLSNRQPGSNLTLSEVRKTSLRRKSQIKPLSKVRKTSLTGQMSNQISSSSEARKASLGRRISKSSP